MIDLAGIQEFESRGRTVHSHYDGREIQRIFYLRPYSKARSVVEAMLGSVTQEVQGGNWTRHFPVREPQYPECYCNEVRTTQIDPRAIASSETVGLNPLALGGETPEARYAKFVEQIEGVPDNPTGGCFLTGSYRPLISAYQPIYEVHEHDGRIFDWIDPHFSPGVRTTPWPDGLQIAAQNVSPILSPWVPAVPDEVAQPVNIPVVEFTVKRLLVGEVPYALLNTLLNSVNDAPWPYFPELSRLPTFAKGTLRFDDYDVVPHYSPGSTHPCWFELVYHFSWLNLKDKPVYGQDGELSGEQGYDHVTWNHVLMRPQIPMTGGLIYRDLGWYFVAKLKYPDWFISEALVQVGPIHSFGKFDRLFMLNPPS